MGGILPMITICFLFGKAYPEILRLGCKVYADFNISLDGLADTGNVVKTLIANGKRECILECASLKTCKAVNFKTDGGNCELVGRIFKAENLASKARWTYMASDENDLNVGQTCKMLSPCQNGAKCKDTCDSQGFVCTCIGLYTGTYCENVKEFASCKAVYDAGYKADGIYLLSNMGYHYCVMSVASGCTGNGWTLVMKTIGNLQTFRYGATYWRSNNVYNQVYSLKQGMDGEEAKFEAYNKLNLTKICLGFRYNGQTNYVAIPINAASMLSLINGGYRGTTLGRSKWLSIIDGAKLQSNCNKEGINPLNHLRIGIAGNNGNDCNSVDSYIGIGIRYRPACQSGYTVRSGNTACPYGENWIATKKSAHSFILIQ